MPYSLKGKCVIKSDTGEVVKCHPTKAKAMAHMKALMANVTDAHESVPMKTTVLIEQLDLSEAVIDADNRTVRQKIITAGKSANKRYYSEAVLQQAASLFENAKAYSNHPSRGDLKDRPERSVREITGWLTDVLFEDGALKATRHFTRTQAGNDSWALVEEIVNKRAPATLMGASINAIGVGKKGTIEDEDVLIVEAITGVNSVDDVTSPAAGGGFERLLASDPADLTQQLLQAISYDEWYGVKPDYVERLKREYKQIRQDTALKASQDVAKGLETALAEVRSEVDALKSDNARLSEELAQTRRELALERALAKVNLPATWKASLHEQLLSAATDKWETIIESEIAKSRSGQKPKIPVTGAPQQVSKPLAESAARNTLAEVRARLARAQSPAEQAAILAEIRSNPSWQ